MNQPNVSQHLARLRDAGLITSQRSSQHITNRLTTPLIVAICSLAGQLVAELDRHRTAETNTRTTATSSGSDPAVTHWHGPPV